MMTKMLFVILIVALISGMSSLVLAGTTTNQCITTANNVVKSCRAGATSDYLLAIAKCDNASDSAACLQQAAADRQDALGTCNDGFDVRSGACDQLGGSAYEPVIDPTNFTTEINNPYFPLTPGTTYVYEGQTSAGLEHDEFTITHRTRVIAGVHCVEVHDTVKVNGKLTEDTLDWFAQDKQGNVWYFGENTHEQVNGLITTTEGTFMAGVDRAKPGIIMEAVPKIGDFYRQEFDLGNAEDFAEVTGLNATVTVPVGTFEHCLRTRETTPLEPDLQEDKFYARGIGNIQTVDRTTGETSNLIKIKKNSE
jgi:hypothetical protein